MEYDLFKHIFELYMKAENHKFLMSKTVSEERKEFHKNKINYCINMISYILDKYSSEDSRLETNILEYFSLKELSKYNGSNGSPAYISINGTVYDVSNISAWDGGTHFGLIAGKDVTKEFNSCHTKDILNKLPKVGIIK